VWPWVLPESDTQWSLRILAWLQDVWGEGQEELLEFKFAMRERM